MPVLRNPKHEIFSQELAKGCDKQEAAVSAGYSRKSASQTASYLVKKPEILARVSEINARIVEKSEWDAARVLIRLGEQAEADILELHNEDGSFKPVKDWPIVWRRMIQGMKVKREKVRSKDGVQAGDSKAWDETGAEILEIKFIDRLDNLKLLGQHKAIDAFVQQKQGDVNVLVVTAEKAREIAGARTRLQRVIDIEAK